MLRIPVTTLKGAAGGAALALMLVGVVGCDSGGGGETSSSEDGGPAPTSDNATGQTSTPRTTPDPSAPAPPPASTTDDWVNGIAGKQIHVFLDATDGSTGGGGEVFVSGGETYDIYLCTDRTFTGTYEDTTCVSVSVPGAGQSSCDGTSTQESYSGTWDVVMQQNIPYLALEIQGLTDTWAFALGSDGTTFFLDQVPATLTPNPYCQ